MNIVQEKKLKGQINITNKHKASSSMLEEHLSSFVEI